MFEKAAMLLHVMEKSLPYPQLKWLHDSALDEVQKLNPQKAPLGDSLKPVPIDPTRTEPGTSFRRVPTGGDMPETIQERIEDE